MLMNISYVHGKLICLFALGMWIHATLDGLPRTKGTHKHIICLYVCKPICSCSHHVNVAHVMSLCKWHLI